MTTKVEPTVEKWEIGYSKIMLDWIESQWKIEAAHQAGEPYTRMKFEADAHKIEQKLLDFIRTLLSHSVQEAKAERDREWIKELKPTGIGNSLYIMPSNHLFDSIKQEEEM